MYAGVEVRKLSIAEEGCFEFSVVCRLFVSRINFCADESRLSVYDSYDLVIIFANVYFFNEFDLLFYLYKKFIRIVSILKKKFRIQNMRIYTK